MRNEVYRNKVYECDGCHGAIDKSDASKTFFIFTMKGCTFNEKYLPTKKLLLCEKCGFVGWEKIRALQIELLERRKLEEVA